MATNMLRHDRLAAEIELLQAMYPELDWNEKHQEVKYTASSGASLVFRVPDHYPGTSHPVLISAIHADRTDLRDLTKDRIRELAVSTDEEMLDMIIQTFDEVVLAHDAKHAREDRHVDDSSHEAMKYKTVVIWLHHLLNTNKRKLALNPSIGPDEIVGVTKPGYPGVLVYSGTSRAIDSHITELKDQRWQAFQVRYEKVTPEAWSFRKTSGIQEVESMSEVVQEISDKMNQITFLQAVGVK